MPEGSMPTGGMPEGGINPETGGNSPAPGGGGQGFDMDQINEFMGNNNQQNTQSAPASPEEAQEQKDQKTNKNITKQAVKVGAEALGASVGAPGVGGMVVDAAEKVPVVGQALNNVYEQGGQAVSLATKLVPGGRQLQDGLNMANDTGMVDAAGNALSAGAGGGAGGVAGGAGGAIPGAGGAAGGMPGMSTGGATPTADLSGSTGGMGMPANQPGADASGSMDMGLPEGYDVQDTMQEIQQPEPAQDEQGDGPEDAIKETIYRLVLPYAFGILGAFIFLAIIVTAVTPNAGGTLDLTNVGGDYAFAGSGNVTYTTEQIEAMLIYVGDSRIQGMNMAIAKPAISYVAETGIGYDWFVGNGRSELVSLLTGQMQLVVIGFGINDLTNIDRYINLYQDLMSTYPNVFFYFMAVGPVEEAKASQNGYSVTNDQIQNFNNKLASAFKDKYIDIYTELGSVYGTTDGVHYDGLTYQRIHGIVISFLKGKHSFNGLTEYPDASASKSLENQTLLDAIGQDGITWLNNYIDSYVNSSGKCTGKGVAAAGMALIDGLHQKGYHLPYYWGGKYNQKGVNPNWGKHQQSAISKNGNYYYYLSLDCSGFVTWAMRNAGVTGGSDALSFVSLGNKITFEQAGPGDVLANSNHVLMVIENKGDYLQTAESTDGGVKFTKTERSKAANYSIIAMNKYYQDHCGS